MKRGAHKEASYLAKVLEIRPLVPSSSPSLFLCHCSMRVNEDSPSIRWLRDRNRTISPCDLCDAIFLLHIYIYMYTSEMKFEVEMHEYWMVAVSKKRFEQMEVQSEVSELDEVYAIFRAAITATGNGTVAITRHLDGKIDAR